MAHGICSADSVTSNRSADYALHRLPHIDGSDRAKNVWGVTASMTSPSRCIGPEKKKLTAVYDRGFSLNGTGICTIR